MLTVDTLRAQLLAEYEKPEHRRDARRVERLRAALRPHLTYRIESREQTRQRRRGAVAA